MMLVGVSHWRRRVVESLCELRVRPGLGPGCSRGRKTWSSCTASSGLDDLGDRAASGRGPQDPPRSSERRARPRAAPSVRTPSCRSRSNCRQRLADDPHLRASTFFDEVDGLGYEGEYSAFTRVLRRCRVRPHYGPCHASTGRNVAVIAHPPGQETQFDWLELSDPPEGWGAGEHAHLLVGALAQSGRWWGMSAEPEGFPHLVRALGQVVHRLGGTARRWRFDRVATVCCPSCGQVTITFAAVVKTYGVGVDLCQPRRGIRSATAPSPPTPVCDRFIAHALTPVRTSMCAGPGGRRSPGPC